MQLGKGLLWAACILAALPAFAGRLEFGDPRVEGDKVTIPVMLTGDLGPGVSSIDFSMRYDAAALTPVNAGAGSASAAADKQVHAHARSEGDYKVVIVGLNSNSLQNGEVATIVMQKNEGSSADRVNMRIVETTFASPDAVQVPSQGDSQTMNLDGSGNSDDEGEDEEMPAEERPNNDREPTGSDNETPGDTNNDAETPSDGGPAPIAADGNSTSYPNEGSTPPVMTADAGQAAAGAPSADGAAPKAAPGQPSAQRMNQAVAAADAVRTTLPTPTTGAAGGDAAGNDGASAAHADGSPAPPSSGDAMVLAQDTTSGQSGALAGAAGDAPSADSPGGPTSDTMVKLSAEGGPEAAQSETAASSGGSSTVLIVVAGVVLAGIAGLVLLRNRLFA